MVIFLLCLQMYSYMSYLTIGEVATYVYRPHPGSMHVRMSGNYNYICNVNNPTDRVITIESKELSRDDYNQLQDSNTTSGAVGQCHAKVLQDKDVYIYYSYITDVVIAF